MKKLAILVLFALPAQAETMMTATDFEAFTKNSTVAFNRHGMPFGAEQYLDDRRVIWSFLDGNCQRGVWYDEGDQICFHYDGQSNPLCWHFFDDNGQQSARLVGDDPVDDLIVVGKNKQPLACPGPEVGVRYSIE
ncbi:MAG: hypothetical protein ABJN34_11100 [Litoreibacter sp.]|uniref:hypothetical protein n=1 Tax=Litoreibacter sp. TaxID=1969459 RepID=UPI0032998606